MEIIDMTKNYLNINRKRLSNIQSALLLSNSFTLNILHDRYEVFFHKGELYHAILLNVLQDLKLSWWPITRDTIAYGLTIVVLSVVIFDSTVKW